MLVQVLIQAVQHCAQLFLNAPSSNSRGTESAASLSMPYPGQPPSELAQQARAVSLRQAQEVPVQYPLCVRHQLGGFPALLVVPTCSLYSARMDTTTLPFAGGTLLVMSAIFACL